MAYARRKMLARLRWPYQACLQVEIPVHLARQQTQIAGGGWGISRSYRLGGGPAAGQPGGHERSGIPKAPPKRTNDRAK